MTQPIVRPNQPAQVPAVVEPSSWTGPQMKLITDVVARGATPDELKLFLYRCEKMGLDPLKAGQIFFIKYGTGPGTIVVGIEGFRSRAARTGKHQGTKRGVLRDDGGKCVGAWAKVYKDGWLHPAETEVALVEYSTEKNNWADMPETMIQKVAEAAALRMAFPDELGDVYTPEEMDKKSGAPRPIVGDQPTIYDGQEPTDYRVTFGQWKKKSIEELLVDPKIGPEAVAKYIAYLEDPAQVAKRKPEQAPLVADFIERASDAIAALERQWAEEAGSRG